MEILNIIEWVGSASAIAGTITLVFKLTPITVTWFLWCISNVLHGALFLYNGQTGLFSLQAGLFALSAIGYINLKLNKTSLLSKLLLGGFFSALLCLAIIVFINIKTGWNTLMVMEWSGAMLSLAASALMAAQTKSQRYAWPMWVLGGIFLILITIESGQLGVLSLQGAFLTLNLWGFHNNFLKPLIVKKIYSQ